MMADPSWEKRAKDLEQAGLSYEADKLPHIRRLNDDLNRAMVDARERGLTDAQIGLRFLDVVSYLTRSS